MADELPSDTNNIITEQVSPVHDQNEEAICAKKDEEPSFAQNVAPIDGKDSSQSPTSRSDYFDALTSEIH